MRVSREKLALAVIWGAIGACALLTLLAPKMTAVRSAGSSEDWLAALAWTGF